MGKQPNEIAVCDIIRMRSARILRKGMIDFFINGFVKNRLPKKILYSRRPLIEPT